MPPKTLADAMVPPYSRNKKVVPKKERIHPALRQAERAFMARARGQFGKRP